MLSRATLFRKFYKAHVYAGLIVALHFAVFALSGLILLFKDEIQTSFSVERAPVEVPQAQELSTSFGKIVSEIEKSFPNDRLLALFPDDEHPHLLHARVGQGDSVKLRGSMRLVYDLNSGLEKKKQEQASSGFFDWMLRLHRELLLGSAGKIYLGFVGLVYVFILVSGFFIYGKFMRNRKFGDLRSDRVLGYADLHKFAGVVTFGWSLVVGLSGVFLAFNGLLIKLFQSRSLRHLSEVYKDAETSSVMAPFSKVIDSALAAKPESVISYISFPNTEFGIKGHFLVLVNGTDRFTERLSELLVINAESGMLTEIVELPLYLKIVLLSEPLHFGDYGGLYLKVLWALFTVLSLAVAGLGVATFILKRKKRGALTAGNLESKSKKPLSRRLSSETPTYLKPTIVVALTFAGLAIALLFDGTFGNFALAALTIPLISFGLRWRPRG